MPDTPQLNYAPRPPMHQRTVFRRWVLVITLFGTIALAWFWVIPAWQRLQLLYWQHRCLVYTPPANQLVYDSTAATVPPSPAEWTKFYTLFSPPGSAALATLFVHERVSPGGEHRLVVIELVGGSPVFGMGPQRSISARVFSPGSLTTPPVESQIYGDMFFADIRLQSFKLYAGAIDPADASHFTIKKVRDGQDIIYDGWLQDGGSISFGPQNPASKKITGKD